MRGHRIELGEIEARILEQPGVAAVVVAVREDSPGERTLAAYVVPTEGGAVSLAELRAALGRALPGYMIPGAFSILRALPLLPNGKVDRRALPAPERVHAPTSALARDDAEARIAALFQNLLGLDRVAVNESFFDLGGHSMMAVKLVEQLNRHFGAGLTLRSLFEAQTVEQLSRLLRDGHDRGRDHTLVPIRPSGTRRPLFLISRPNVNSLGYLALSRHLDASRPIYGLQRDYPEEQDLGRPFTREEYEGWARDYLETIRLVQPKGPYLLGGMCEGALIAFTMTHLLEAEGEEVTLLAMFDAWPEENTRRRWIHELAIYEKRLRSRLDQGMIALLGFIREKVASALRPRRRGATALEHAGDNLWEERIFPGPGFVPSRVAAPITVFKVKKQPYWRIHDEELGWGDRTRSGVTTHLVEGNHQTILRAPYVASLGRALDAHLRKVDAGRQGDGAR